MNSEQTVESLHYEKQHFRLKSEPILPIRRIRKLRRAPETPGGTLALKDVLILVSFLSFASGYENMNDHFF